MLGSAPPTLDDRGRLPYCEATIMEVQRLSCVAPAGLGNRVPEDVRIEGYRIPKDTLLVYNIHRFHTDPDYWGDPEVFRPERFLAKDWEDEEGVGRARLVKHERFLPFGFGRRVCMGESLAKAELFIFCVIIMQV